MAYFTKNIAVIKGAKSGFSVDGGALSGVIKTQKYGSYLKAEVTLINFAPLSGGRYVIALSDGVRTVIFGEEGFEGECGVDISCGYGAAVCFVINGGVKQIGAAICGDYAFAVECAFKAVVRAEGSVCESCGSAEYDDEAVAEENYYEQDGKNDESGGTVRQNTAQTQENSCGKDEDAGGLRRKPEEKIEDNFADIPQCLGDSTGVICKNDADGNHVALNNNEDGNPADRQNTDNTQTIENNLKSIKNNPQNIGESPQDRARQIPLSQNTCFYDGIKAEAERIFAAYPKEAELEEIIENSRWVKISYGKGKHYVFGVIYAANKPSFICYGVPASNPEKPPAPLKGKAGYIPAQNGGYWVMYQDAITGISVNIDNI